MTVKELETSLRRIEGQLAMLLRHIDEDIITLREQNEALARDEMKAYRRGYGAGLSRASKRYEREQEPTGGDVDTSQALNRRRRRTIAA
jgi:hypothetical protein